jgi:phosphatidylserine decarboxylase
VEKGECLGYFQFGGSTCVMLTQQRRVTWDDDVAETAVTGTELLVQMGQQVGTLAVADAAVQQQTH